MSNLIDTIDFRYRLGVNFEECKGSIVSIDELYHHCQNLQPTYTKDVTAKAVTVLFKVETTMCYLNGERFIAYKDLRKRTDSEQKEVVLPSFCTPLVQQSSILRFECSVSTIVNEQLLKCTVTLSDSDTIVAFADLQINCGYSLSIDQRSVDGILHAVHCFRICSGVSFVDKLPKTFNKETVSFLHDENTIRSIGRSKYC